MAAVALLAFDKVVRQKEVSSDPGTVAVQVESLFH
jgi:hypothetical protein